MYGLEEICHKCGKVGKYGHAFHDDDGNAYCFECGILECHCPRCGKQFTDASEVWDYDTLVCCDCKNKEFKEQNADRIYFETDPDCDPIYISKSQGVLVTTYDGGYCASATPVRALADFLNAYLKDHPEL